MTVAEKSDNESSDDESDCECDEQQNDEANLDAQKKKIGNCAIVCKMVTFFFN